MNLLGRKNPSTDQPDRHLNTKNQSSSTRKAKAHEGSGGPSNEAPDMTGSLEHFSEAETSGPLADGEASLSGSDVKFWGDDQYRQQGPMGVVQPLAGDPSYAGHALRVEPPAAALPTAGVSLAAEGANRTTLAILGSPFPTENDMGGGGDGDVSEREGVLSVCDFTGDDRQCEAARKTFSSKGGGSGGLDSGGRSGSRTNGTAKNDDIGADKSDTDQKVCDHLDWLGVIFEFEGSHATHVDGGAPR